MGEKKQATIATKNNRLNETHVKLFVVLSTLGIITSAYLVKDHFSAQKSFCDLGTRISCQIINKSSFAKLFNVPVAVFGVSWFLAQLWSALKFWESDRDALVWAQTLLLWTASGVFFALYLILAEVILGAICPLCTVVHVTVGLQLWLAWQMYRQTTARYGSPGGFNLLALARTQRNFIIVAGILHLLPLVYFNAVYVPEAPPSLPSQPADELAQFADCLTTEGLVMYGSKSCTFCQRQRDLFGPAFDRIEYVDCGAEIPRCQASNITALPTWIRFSGNPAREVGRQTGARTLRELSSFAAGKCPLATPS